MDVFGIVSAVVGNYVTLKCDKSFIIICNTNVTLHVDDTVKVSGKRMQRHILMRDFSDFKATIIEADHIIII